MMNYYEARQRESDQRWDYTCRNDNYTWAVGYCRAFEAWTKEKAAEYGLPVSSNALAKEASFAHKHHTDGHATPEKACDCYREYLLDQKASYLRSYVGTQYPCIVCGIFSEFFASVGDTNFDLCLQHNNSITVREHFKAPEKTISST